VDQDFSFAVDIACSTLHPSLSWRGRTRPAAGLCRELVKTSWSFCALSHADFGNPSAPRGVSFTRTADLLEG
jgi:hypothetical protein